MGFGAFRCACQLKATHNVQAGPPKPERGRMRMLSHEHDLPSSSITPFGIDCCDA